MGQKQHTGSWIKNNVEAGENGIEQMADRITIQALPARIFKLFFLVAHKSHLKREKEKQGLGNGQAFCNLSFQEYPIKLFYDRI